MPATRKRFLTRVVAVRLLAVLLLSSGCSVVTSWAPIKYEPNQGPPECMRAPVGPVLDLVAVPGALLAGAVVDALDAMGRYCDEDVCDPAESRSDKWFLLAGGLAVSSVYGLVQTARCNAAHDRYDDYRAAGGITTAIEPAPVSSICRVWQRRYQAATTVDEQREVLREANPECRPLLGPWPASP